jgi:hypothetical protein
VTLLRKRRSRCRRQASAANELGQAIRRESRDYVIDQPDGSQVIYSGAQGYAEALRDVTLAVG